MKNRQAVGKDRWNARNNGSSSAHPSRPTPLGSAAAIKFVANDQIRVGKIEDRLKQWHAEFGDDGKTQIRPLTRYVRTDFSSPSIPAGKSSDSNLMRI